MTESICGGRAGHTRFICLCETEPSNESEEVQTMMNSLKNSLTYSRVKELNMMESLKVTEKIYEPNEWVSSLVIVDKRTESPESALIHKI